MVLTPSSMLPLGTELPEFRLTDTVSKEVIVSTELEGKLVLVGFICNHCPYVVHIKESLSRLGNQSLEQGVSVVMISSNDVENYPQDGPLKMTEFAKTNGFQFPYCYDETQAVAKVFEAACTPEFYLFDGERQLIYRGQFDSSRPGSQTPSTGEDLKDAVELGLQGKIRERQTPSVGCNIKWRSGTPGQ